MDTEGRVENNAHTHTQHRHTHTHTTHTQHTHNTQTHTLIHTQQTQHADKHTHSYRGKYYTSEQSLKHEFCYTSESSILFYVALFCINLFSSASLSSIIIFNLFQFYCILFFQLNLFPHIVTFFSAQFIIFRFFFSLYLPFFDVTVSNI